MSSDTPRTACLLIPNLPLAAELRAHPELGGEPLAVASGRGPRAELTEQILSCPYCGEAISVLVDDSLPEHH
ncbi:MAG: hypothetical protein JRD03_11725, partial [Deltaproteobacteria bacterium]|nr:hypothetical protein [Deltaproteobacteria bacterium]